MQNYLWDYGSVWDTGLKQEVFDYIQCRQGGRKELKSMCSQVKSQVFTGYCRKVICVLGLKPNKHFDCSGVIYLKEKNVTSFLTIKGSKDSFRISHFKFGNILHLITYILMDCVGQGSCEWWQKEEKSFCSSWSHWRNGDRFRFSYSRKGWRSPAEEIKNWPSLVFWSWSFSQSSQSCGVKSIYKELPKHLQGIPTFSESNGGQPVACQVTSWQGQCLGWAMVTCHLQALLAKMWLSWNIEEKRCWDRGNFMAQSGGGLPLLCRNWGLDFGLINTQNLQATKRTLEREYMWFHLPWHAVESWIIKIHESFSF